MKERHVRFRLAQGPVGASLSAIAWNMADRVAEMTIAENSLIDIAYKLRGKEYTNGGGVEIELLDMRPDLSS